MFIHNDKDYKGKADGNEINIMDFSGPTSPIVSETKVNDLNQDWNIAGFRDLIFVASDRLYIGNYSIESTGENSTIYSPNGYLVIAS